MASTKDLVKTSVSSFYDIQKLRMQVGLRIYANFSNTVDPEMKESVIDILLKDREKIIDALAVSGKKKIGAHMFTGTRLLTNDAEYALTELYVNLRTQEEAAKKLIDKLVKTTPIWNEFLVNVKGVGPAMAGVLISNIDIKKVYNPTSLFKYIGIDVAEDGRGRSARKEHLVPKVYTSAKGDVVNTRGLSYKPFLKSKVMGVLADLFIKLGSEYRVYYDQYKLDKADLVEKEIITKLHLNNRAKRHMMKKFLIDLYVNWRRLEGLSVSTKKQ